LEIKKLNKLQDRKYFIFKMAVDQGKLSETPSRLEIEEQVSEYFIK
jgi:hypothetical protein